MVAATQPLQPWHWHRLCFTLLKNQTQRQMAPTSTNCKGAPSTSEWSGRYSADSHFTHSTVIIPFSVIVFCLVHSALFCFIYIYIYTFFIFFINSASRAASRYSLAPFQALVTVQRSWVSYLTTWTTWSTRRCGQGHTLRRRRSSLWWLHTDMARKQAPGKTLPFSGCVLKTDILRPG